MLNSPSPHTEVFPLYRMHWYKHGLNGYQSFSTVESENRVKPVIHPHPHPHQIH